MLLLADFLLSEWLSWSHSSLAQGWGEHALPSPNERERKINASYFFLEIPYNQSKTICICIIYIYHFDQLLTSLAWMEAASLFRIWGYLSPISALGLRKSSQTTGKFQFNFLSFTNSFIYHFHSANASLACTMCLGLCQGTPSKRQN